MKKLFCTFFLIGSILFTTGNSFGTTFYDQANNIKEGVWTDPTITGGTSLLGINSTLVDTIGNGFNTTQVNISESGGDGTIEIFTEFKGFETIGKTELELADFFISTATGSYGIDLSWSNGGVSSGGIYKLDSDTVIYNSQDIFVGDYDTPFGAVYKSAAGFDKINVDFVQETDDFLGSVDVSSTTFGYSIGIDSAIVASMDLSNGYSFLFGTAECGNDVIYGAVPEPSTLLLLGFGLLGVGALGRRKTEI